MQAFARVVLDGFVRFFKFRWVRFPLRIAGKFLVRAHEVVPNIYILVKCFWLTLKLWRHINSLLSKNVGSGNDADYNGLLVWNVARMRWAPKLAEYGRLNIVIKGAEKVNPERTYVVAVTHTSTLDIPIVILAVPNGMFIAKIEVVKFHFPVIGQVVKKCGQIIVDRSDPSQSIPAIDNGVQLRPHTSPIFFIGGTRARDGHIGKQIRKGAFQTAIKFQLPLLPVVISGAYRALSPSSLVDLKTGSTIYVDCLDSIETKGMTVADLPDLVADVKSRMMDVYYGYNCNPARPQGL